MYIAIGSIVLLYLFGLTLAIYNLKEILKNKQELIKARRKHRQKHKNLWYKAVKEELDKRRSSSKKRTLKKKGVK